MLLSMTGYGKGESHETGSRIKVEIKSLNGKMPDIRMRIPTRFKEKEIELRKRIQESAHRGKMDVTITVDGNSGDDEFDLNPVLFKRYLGELKSIASDEGIDQADLIGAVMRFPNVVQTVDTSVSEQEWNDLQNCLEEALANLKSYRSSEGEAMKAAISNHVESIASALQEVTPLDAERLLHVRNRINGNVREHLNGDTIDENRFEQELLYYLEKLDISEEKIRLQQHCTYFLEILKTDDEVKGKKLAFIGQEMGREINTLGAKAQFSPIQKLVVGMKDDLEKIKEQLANII